MFFINPRKSQPKNTRDILGNDCRLNRAGLHGLVDTRFVQKERVEEKHRAMDQEREAVVWVGFTAKPSFGFQAIEQSAEGGSLYFQDFGQFSLNKSVATIKMGQDPPLRSGQPDGFCSPVKRGSH